MKGEIENNNNNKDFDTPHSIMHRVTRQKFNKEKS